MTEAQEVQLARIHGRATRYEAVLVNRATGQRLLFCYCRKTRAGLVEYLRAGDTGPALSAFTGQLTFQPARPGDQLTIGDWSIRFSGRTQRDAILAGELAWWKGKVQTDGK